MEGCRQDVHSSLLLLIERFCEWLGKRCLQHTTCWDRGAMCYERYNLSRSSVAKLYAGDKVCRTLLCSPEKAKQTVKSYLKSQNFGEEIKAKVQIPSLLSVEDAETYEEARKEMNQEQKRGKFPFEKKRRLYQADWEERGRRRQGGNVECA